MTRHFGKAPDKTWSNLFTYQTLLVKARALFSEGVDKSTVEAIRLLEDLLTDKRLPRYLDSTPLNLLLAEITGARGDSQAAYDVLLRPMAEQPNDELYKSLLQYGAKLNKTTAQVEVGAVLQQGL